MAHCSTKAGPAVALKITLLQTPRIWKRRSRLVISMFRNCPLNLIRTANVFIYILFTMFVIFCPVVLFQSRDLKWFDWAAFWISKYSWRRGICKLHQITNLYYICLFHGPSLWVTRVESRISNPISNPLYPSLSIVIHPPPSLKKLSRRQRSAASAFTHAWLAAFWRRSSTTWRTNSLSALPNATKSIAKMLQWAFPMSIAIFFKAFTIIGFVLISSNHINQLYSHSHWNSCRACGHLEPTCIAPTSAASMWCPVMAKRSAVAAGKETWLRACDADGTQSWHNIVQWLHNLSIAIPFGTIMDHLWDHEIKNLRLWWKNGKKKVAQSQWSSEAS